MKKDTQRSLPPVIRVFLSSTFADMDKERSYFNEVLVPKINRICSDRGVSFFSVDLRWGITEEEQINGQVLPICLSEIDKCRPYFIGMIGNRYGSILERVPENISEMIPWLVGKEGHSITELEMMYAVLEHNDEATVANSAFYIRSDELTKQLYGDLKQESDVALESLAKLKQTIEEDNDTPSSHYSSIEEFGSFVMRDILNWLDINFPESEDIDAIRSEWYNSEILRNHIENTDFHGFLDSYIKQSRKPLLIYGDGARGKTASLTSWTPSEGHKVIVNCGADDKYSYWPSIVDEVVRQLAVIAKDAMDEDGIAKIATFAEKLEKNKNSTWSQKKQMFFITESAVESFRQDLIKWFSEFEPKEKITVVINDLNLLEDERAKILCWLPTETRGNLKLICSTNDDEMVSTAEALGWNIKEMPELSEEHAELFIKEYLSTFGKSLSAAQLDSIVKSHAAKFPGLLRFIIRFLINYGRFENLDGMINSIAECDDIQQIYVFIYNYLIKDYSDNERRIAGRVLAIVRHSIVSLRENECYDLACKSCDITPIEWANICRAFEQLEIVHGDYWKVQNEETEKFINYLLSEDEMKSANELLGDFMLEMLWGSWSGEHSTISPRMGARYSKAALSHYVKSSAFGKLESALEQRTLLEFLYLPEWSAIRSAWMQLLLHTDVDIVESISSLAKEYLLMEKHYEKRIGKLLIGILIDFEFEARANELCQELGIDNPGGTIDTSSPGITAQFVDVYKKIRFLKERKDERALYEFVCALINSDIEFSKMDRCQLMYYKNNSEINLAYYSEALESANEYYRLAIRMGFLFEIKRALSMRAGALARLGRYDETLQINERTTLISLSEGEIRSYLGDLNLTAMTYYKMGRYDESIAIFDDLLGYWEKLGNLLDMSVIVMNRCNAVYYKSGDKAALTLAEEWYPKIEGNKDLIFQSSTLLGNMGLYAYGCGEYDKAEKYLSETIDISKKHGFESALIKAYNILIDLYSATENVGKRHDIYSAKLDLLWKRAEYEELITTLKDEINELIIVKHNKKVREIEEYWKNKFATLNGGYEYFEEKIRADSLDSISIESLEERLIIAKSEGNSDKIVRCYVDLADAIGDKDIPKSVEYLLSAIDILRAAGNKEMVYECAADALKLLIKNCKPLDEELLRSVYERAGDSALYNLILLWMLPASGKENNASELIRAIANQHPTYKRIVVNALVDLAAYSVDNLSGEELVAICDSLPNDGSRYDVVSAIEDVMLENLQKNGQKLAQDYMSSEAEALILRYEKCITFLSRFDRDNAATFAGNIAIIFRRRGDKEKTFNYHKLSMDIFSEQNKHKDKLIEMTNLATAYNAFDETDKAIELLREAMVYAHENGEHLQHALVADNLADFLRSRGHAEDREEILGCFAVGEDFFRRSGYTRDLVISLGNQLSYLYDKEPIEVWEGKLYEFKELVESNGFDEFKRNLRVFEWYLSQQKNEKESVDIDEARSKIMSLVSKASEQYDLLEEQTLDNYFKFRFGSKEQVGGREELYIFYDRKSENAIYPYFAYLPATQPDNFDKLMEYISWWNSIGNYSLEWNNEGGFIRARMTIVASTWDAVCSEFLNYLNLWNIDKTAIISIFGGYFDMLREIQGMKLKLLDR